ncbi:MAG: undecaprenyl phosphate translocase family protein [Bradymonadia bacterium]
MNTRPNESAAVPTPLLVFRGLVGGLLMGLANLVPGISGGTMLVAAGVYHRFINAIAELTTLKFRKHSIILLGAVGFAAAGAILLLAGPVKDLVVSHRWAMYSLFIGLTLGGVPVVWGMIDKATNGVWIAAAVGCAAMVGLALAQGSNPDAAAQSGFLMMFLAGVVGASAMILPGISGGYMLLLMGVYVPILDGIAALKDGLKAKDMDLVMQVGLDVVLPVGLGVVIGVVVVSNILKRLLERAERPTLGVLLGLLVGAVAGLWPFQQGVAPAVGETFKGKVLTAETLAKLDPSKYPTEYYSPETTQMLGALGLLVGGFLFTALVARLGRDKG